MLFLASRVHQDIIYEYDDKFVKEGTYFVHQFHNGYKGICKPKWNHKKIIMFVLCMEGYLRDIRLPDFQLVVTQSQINLRKERGFVKLIKQVVNSWQRVSVLYGYFIKLLGCMSPRSTNYCSCFFNSSISDSASQ